MDLQSWDSGLLREFVITTNEQYPQDVSWNVLKTKQIYLMD